MAAGLEGLARKRMEESPMPFFTNQQGLAGMDVGLSTGVSPFCVMRYNASAFFDQSNQEAKNASAHYMRKFWGQSIPPKELTSIASMTAKAADKQTKQRLRARVAGRVARALRRQAATCRVVFELSLIHI